MGILSIAGALKWELCGGLFVHKNAGLAIPRDMIAGTLAHVIQPYEVWSFRQMYTLPDSALLCNMRLSGP